MYTTNQLVEYDALILDSTGNKKHISEICMFFFYLITLFIFKARSASCV